MSRRTCRSSYPDIRLHIAETHRAVDLVREGFDCILRTGELADSALIRRRLALLPRGTFASPDYVRRFGAPRTIDDLESGHCIVGFVAPDRPEDAPLTFTINGKVRKLTLPATITVTAPETRIASACRGLGLIQAPRYRIVSELAAGALVEVLANCPPSPLPVYVLYSHAHLISPRLRVFIDWMAEQYRARADG